MENSEKPTQLDITVEEIKKLAEYAENMEMDDEGEGEDEQFGGTTNGKKKYTLRQAKLDVAYRELVRQGKGDYTTKEGVPFSIQNLSNKDMFIICAGFLANCFILYKRYFAGGKKTRHTKRNNKRKSKRNNKRKSKRNNKRKSKRKY